MKNLINYLERWTLLGAVGLSLVVVFLDYITGPYISFPVLYVFPVALLAWFRPRRWAMGLAVILCATRQALAVPWTSATNFDLSIILVNGLIDLSVFFLVVLLIARVAKQQRALEARVRTLEGILPVCSFCKKIRNEENKWEPMEVFICRNSEAQFSHSVCPDCGQQHYGAFYDQAVDTPESTIVP